MPLAPLLIQQGMSITQFLVWTLKTNPLGMIAIFTVSDMGIKKWLKRKGGSIKGQLEITFYALTVTLLTGPYLIDWITHSYHYLNEKMGEFTDDFFNYTSALGIA